MPVGAVKASFPLLHPLFQQWTYRFYRAAISTGVLALWFCVGVRILAVSDLAARVFAYQIGLNDRAMTNDRALAAIYYFA